jgi:transaldolase
MKFFIDTAEVEEIKKAAAVGIIDGVTTNPSLIAKSGRVFEDVVKEITDIVDGPISAEVTALDVDGMLREAEPLLKIHDNITIKVPMTEAGVTACKKLADDGVKVNVTLIFHVNQALLAAKAGATFVSPFAGRLDDIGQDGMLLIDEIAHMFSQYNFDTQILAASIRNPEHVKRAALAGAHVSTMPPAVFHKLFDHHLTTAGIEKFLADWENAKK